MRVYLHSDNAEKSPRYTVTVAPAGDTGFVIGNDALPEWKHPDGSPKQIEVVFAYGSADVPDPLGKYMVARDIAKRSRLLRQVSKLFDRNGRPIEEAFDEFGRPVLLDTTQAA